MRCNECDRETADEIYLAVDREQEYRGEMMREQAMQIETIDGLTISCDRLYDGRFLVMMNGSPTSISIVLTQSQADCLSRFLVAEDARIPLAVAS